MHRRDTFRSPVLDVEGLRELLDLTKHEVRALLADAGPEDFRYVLLTHTPRLADPARTSADREA